MKAAVDSVCMLVSSQTGIKLRLVSAAPKPHKSKQYSILRVQACLMSQELFQYHLRFRLKRDSAYVVRCICPCKRGLWSVPMQMMDKYVPQTCQRSLQFLAAPVRPYVLYKGVHREIDRVPQDLRQCAIGGDAAFRKSASYHVLQELFVEHPSNDVTIRGEGQDALEGLGRG